MGKQALTKEELIEKLKGLKNTIRMVNDFQKAYDSIRQAISEEGFEEEINLAPGFFSVTRNALIRGMVIETSKLFDNDRRAYSLLNFLNSCAQSLPAMQFKAEGFLMTDHRTGKESQSITRTEAQIKEKFREDIALWHKEKKALNSAIENLRKQRNKFYAHIDEGYMTDVDALVRESPISLSEIKKLIEYASKVYTGIEVYLTKNHTMLCAINSGDLSRLLDKAKHGETSQ